MSSELYVFETVHSNGTRVQGTAGLPYHDMARLKTFYTDKVTRIVPGPAGTSRLEIVTPVYLNPPPNLKAV